MSEFSKSVIFISVPFLTHIWLFFTLKCPNPLNFRECEVSVISVLSIFWNFVTYWYSSRILKICSDIFVRDKDWNFEDIEFIKTQIIPFNNHIIAENGKGKQVFQEGWSKLYVPFWTQITRSVLPKHSLGNRWLRNIIWKHENLEISIT